MDHQTAGRSFRQLIIPPYYIEDCINTLIRFRTVRKCLMVHSKKCCFVKSVYKWMFLYKWSFYDLFWPFFCKMYDHLSQNWGSDGHFEVLNRSYLSLVQKLWHKTQIFPFPFFLRFCTKADICIFFVFYVFVFFVITFVPIKI